MKLQDIIIAETENWVALNKPSGLLSIPDREGKEESLKKLLQVRYEKIFTVHRIDRDTSGLIIFARNEEAHKFLSKQFEGRQTIKIYTGLVLGSLTEKEGSINSPIAEHPAQNGTMIIHRNGKEALTDYIVIEDFGIYSLLEFRIHTGRTHQIRIHMKEKGHPIVCDPLYGDGKPVLISALKKKYNLSKKEEEEKPILGRLALHSYRLSFKDLDGQTKEVEAAMYKDMRATIQQLEKRTVRKN
ncbi:MAG: RNA pseudouridine synthase [Chitinophagaceae bacterium]|nr:RNA pseudouridine synthase [Chitinophagaceae bacterium]